MSLSIGPCSSSEGGTAYTQKNCIINSATGTKEDMQYFLKKDYKIIFEYSQLIK